jgi:hypothetical protein
MKPNRNFAEKYPSIPFISGRVGMRHSRVAKVYLLSCRIQIAAFF